MVSLHTAPHLHVCRSVTRARAKWSVNALQCCEAIYRGLGVVAENILWPAGTRGARKRSRKKNDWGWRDAASRYPQSLPRHVFFRAPHVPAGRESFLKTASNPRYNAPRHYNAFADHFALCSHASHGPANKQARCCVQRDHSNPWSRKVSDACVRCGAKDVGRMDVAGSARRRQFWRRVPSLWPRGAVAPRSTTIDWR